MPKCPICSKLLSKIDIYDHKKYGCPKEYIGTDLKCYECKYSIYLNINDKIIYNASLEIDNITITTFYDDKTFIYNENISAGKEISYINISPDNIPKNIHKRIKNLLLLT